MAVEQNMRLQKLYITSHLLLDSPLVYFLICASKNLQKLSVIQKNLVILSLEIIVNNRANQMSRDKLVYGSR